MPLIRFAFLSILTALAFSSFSTQEATASKLKNEDEKNRGFEIDQFEVSDNVIWGLEFLPTGELLFTEKPGRIKIWNPQTKQVRLVADDLEVDSRGSGGLLDIKLHPEFAKNQFVYWTQSFRKGDKNTTRLMRAELVNRRLKNRQVLLDAEAWEDSASHFGSRLVFDREGSLYMSLGDRNVRREVAQDLQSHAGKVLRLTADGKAHPDNPFFGKPKEGRPEIFSWGHRNPQGLAVDEKNQIWLSEHGPRGGDEINLLGKGKNYGWPLITYGEEYRGGKIGETHREGLEQPRHKYVPSIAPCGLLILKGSAFPEWKGDFFLGALAGAHLNQVRFKNNVFEKETRLLTDLRERIRDVEEDAQGWIYVSTDTGRIYRLRPAPTAVKK